MAHQNKSAEGVHQPQTEVILELRNYLSHHSTKPHLKVYAESNNANNSWFQQKRPSSLLNASSKH
jgi:hypothetical protein